MNQTSPPESAASQVITEALGRWQAMGLRERRALSLTGALILVFSVWAIALQPALQTLAKAPAELDRLEVQLQEMYRMMGESRELRGIAPVSATQAIASMQSATDRLGQQGRVTIQGDRITLTLINASPEALKEWLLEVRSAARARPLEAQLNRSITGYSGTILLVMGSSS